MVLEIRTISDRLVDIIRDRILSGEIPPSVPIRQDSLAAELQISKIPLREALARLEQDGLLVSHPNRGFFVRDLSTGEAEEVFALRLKIEPDAAAFACRATSEQERQEAQLALKRLVVAAAAHEPTVGALNRAFHLALVRPGGQVVTTNVVRGLHIIADRYVRKHLEPHYRHIRAESEHQEIIDAWLKPDPRKVKKLLFAHLEHTLKDLRVQLAEDSPAGAPVPQRVSVKRAAPARGAGGKKKKPARRPQRSLPHSR
jgi:DNA-binding GntR family transcriptional regulator